MYLLKKRLRRIASIHGRGTELLTLLVPKAMRLPDVVGRLRSEEQEASNIKSSVTRERVLEALTRSLSILSLYKKVPKNGLCVFVGRVDEKSGTSMVEEVFEAPAPLRSFVYRFDEHFHVDSVAAGLENQRRIGIVAIDTEEVGIGVLSGEHLEVVRVLTSGIGGSTKKGGSSSRRYERDRDSRIIQFFNRSAEAINGALVGDRPVDGLLVGGPGFTKEDFLKRGVLDYRLKDKIIGVVDSEYSGREGIRSIVDRSGDLLKESRAVEEKRLVDAFLKEIAVESGKVVYGMERVVAALDRGTTRTLLIVEGDEAIESIDEKASLAGTRLEVISRNSEAGRMLEGFRIVAFLN